MINMETASKTNSVPVSIEREQQLIKLLMSYLASGLFFMLLPGTFLGVWNLFAISNAQSAMTVPTPWIQAHGHAQLFGWIGTFILGIGFYSIPNLRRVSAWSFWEGWLAWGLWTGGVALRWLADVYLWQWRILLPVSAALELLAVVLFLACSIQGHRMQRKSTGGLESWAVLVIAGSGGLLLTMCLNAFLCFTQAAVGADPALPPEFNGLLLLFSVWAFPVPIAWGFTAHWMPVFLGLKPLRTGLLYNSLVLNLLGLVAAACNLVVLSSVILLTGAICISIALRLYEPTDKPAKTQGVHKSFPLFIRLANLWLLVAASLGVWAAIQPSASGIGGAGRHAVTVGFLMTMVFAVAPRVLPAFLGRKSLFSQRLMFFSLLLSNAGCFLRVASEIIAYQQYADWAWSLLPVSATLELTAVVLFTINMIGTLLQPARYLSQ